MRQFKKQTPEGEVKLAIIKYALLRGFIGGKVNTMGVFRKDRYCRDPYLFTGFPDLVFFRPCKKSYYDLELIFVEVKSEKGTPSERQLDFLGYCKRAGIKYILAHSLDEFIEGLEK